MVNDSYQFGHLAYQSDGAGTLPATDARYYYVYNARGDVVNLTDVHGAVVASYSYDTWGALTSVSETIPNANGWVNPYRYDGRDGVRSDAATSLDWMRVRAYDPTLGRFLSRDPLGRVPLFLSDNPYVYAGNNPLSNVDPSGQYRVAGQGATRAPSEPFQYRPPVRVVTTTGTPVVALALGPAQVKVDSLTRAKDLAGQTSIIFVGAAAAFSALAVGLQVAANFLFGQAAEFTTEALISFALPPIAAGFLTLAAAALALGVIAEQAGYQARILAGESTTLAVAFGYESYDDDMTVNSLQNGFTPALSTIVAAFAVASLLWTTWSALMGIQAIANLAVGIGKSFLLDGTLLAWSMGRVQEMEADLQL